MNFATSNTSNRSDEVLLYAFQQQGDAEALGALYHRYLHLVYGLCLKYLKHREEAQDAVMDIYELLTDKLGRHKVSYFKSWLYVVVKNHCLMTLRKEPKNRERFMEIESLSHPIIEVDTLHDDLDALEQCIEALRYEQKTCVQLFFLKQKSYREIVDLTHFKLSKVKSYIQNGKRNLKLCLQSKNVQR